MCRFVDICKYLAKCLFNFFSPCHAPPVGDAASGLPFYLWKKGFWMALPSASMIDEFQRFAEHMADRARTLSLPPFRRELAVQLKADESPVTAIDRDVETLMRDCIQAAYPDHGILGEEHGRRAVDADYVWSLDPIDGTRSYISGWPLWGSLMALLHRGLPVLGVIDMPVLNERWVGVRGIGTHMNGEPCRSGTCTRLAEATVYATSPDIFTAEELAAFERVGKAARGRRFGGDCYSYALLASGHIDAVIESDLKPYDYLALTPVIEAAGGVITDWNGQPLGMHSGGQVVAAATSALHQQMLALLAN
jgi:histidinol phosphatase-like enzyme (inositol monophosphatase family)